jgi:hypothetical protein
MTIAIIKSTKQYEAILMTHAVHLMHASNCMSKVSKKKHG